MMEVHDNYVPRKWHQDEQLAQAPSIDPTHGRVRIWHGKRWRFSKLRKGHNHQEILYGQSHPPNISCLWFVQAG